MEPSNQSHSEHAEQSPSIVHVSRAESRGPSLMISLTVDGIPVNAVIDTGAEATIMSEETYSKLPAKSPSGLKNVCLRNAETGREMSATGGVAVEFRIGSKVLEWTVCIAPIRDALLLGLDFLKAADFTIHASGKVFMGSELMPAYISEGKGPDYAISRVMLERDVTVPPECECLVWGVVDDPNPELPAVLEPVTLADGVSSGSIMINMERRIPVRLYNVTASSRPLLRGVCLGVLIEAYPDAQEEGEIAHIVPGDATLYAKDRNSTTQYPANEPPGEHHIRRVSSPNALDLPEHLRQLFTGASETLTEQQQVMLVALLSEYQTVFAATDDDHGKFSALQHSIDTGVSKPVRQPVRRTPLGFWNEEETHLKKMLDSGIVVPSSSEWASPIVLVRKKDGGVRWCVDYRQLNDLTIKDAYPLPKIEECLDVLGGAKTFSTLDLQSGYWQIEMNRKDRSKTAFVARYGLYEYTRMPFGLCNAPSTFQRAMELVLRGLQWDTLLIYLYDIIIFGEDVEQCMERLAEVFQRLQEYGLKLKPSKCHLLRDEVLFLGHVVSGEGIKTNPALIDDVRNWKTPTSVQELQSFLGLCNYYMRFVAKFAEITTPLTMLLKKGSSFSWEEEQKKAFEHLKRSLTTAPILVFPITSGQFVLDTDASNQSIGAVLSQLQWGEEKVISFASCLLTPANQRYCVTRRETDSLPCKGCRFCRKLHHQWARFEEDVDDVIPLAVRRTHSLDRQNEDSCANTPSDVDEVGDDNPGPSSNWLQPMSSQSLREEQLADPDLSVLHNWMSDGYLPAKEEVMMHSSAVRKYWLCWSQVEMRDGVLYYRWDDLNGGMSSLRLLVPVSLKNEVLQSCHNPAQAGHSGEEKTLMRLRRCYQWYNMRNDVRLFVKKCLQCSSCKTTSPMGRAKLQSYQAGAPMDRLHLDILGPFPESKSGNRYILVIIDQFTRWVEAFPVPEQGAETTAKRLVFDFISRFGAPLEIHTDQGRNFESSLFMEVCRLLQVTKTRTTPYHPASNGQVERFNRTLLQMIRCYVDQSLSKNCKLICSRLIR
ncbi:interleukin-1 receptor accessory protein-like 1-A [Pimephales promelas]|nr:interleukin-1 receptor accessory protein-like 1-A [Pimephales promelas]